MLAKIDGAVEPLVQQPQAVDPLLPVKLLSDWYVLATRGGREGDAVDSFRRRGYSAFWPNYAILKPSREKTNGRRGRGLRRSGVVKGVIFVQRREGYCLPIEYTDEIVGLLGPVRTATGDPFVLSNADIDRLKLIETALNMPIDEQRQLQWIDVHTKTLAPGMIDVSTLKHGEKLSFSDGALKGWGFARFMRLERHDRIVVEVDAMGQTLEFTVALHQIERT